MKTSYLFAITALGVALAAPVSAHDNSPWSVDGIEIGDMQDLHEAAIAEMAELYNGNTDNVAELDPSNMSDDIDPQPNGVDIPDDVLVPGSGPVSGSGID
jgi:hypothetical protein